MSEEPERFERLQRNSTLLHDGLVKACLNTKFHVQGHTLSPMQHIYWGNDANSTKDNQMLVEKHLDELVEGVIY